VNQIPAGPITAIRHGCAWLAPGTLKLEKANAGFFRLFDLDENAPLPELPAFLAGASLPLNACIREIQHNELDIRLSLVETAPESWMLLAQDISQQVKQQHIRREEALLFNRILSEAVRTSDSLAVLTTICAELARVMEAPQSAVALLDEDQHELKVVAEYSSPGLPSVIGELIPLEANPATQWVMAHRQPLAIRNILEDERVGASRNLLRSRGTVGLLIIPLLIQNRLIGTLGLDTPEPRDFSPDEIALAMSMATAASQVLEMTRLVQSVRRELVERKRVEKELAQSEARYRLVMDSVKEIIFQLDNNTRWIFVNPAWQETTGFSRDEIMGRSFFDYVLPDDRQHMHDLFELLHVTRLYCRDEIRMPDSSGQTHWFQVFATLTLENGQPTGIAGTLLDVTHEHQAAEARERSEAFIRALYEITAEPTLNTSDRLQRLLKLGCSHFGLETGILSRVEEDTYEIVEAVSAERHLERGTTMPLRNTFCRDVLEANMPVGFEHAAHSQWLIHPAYQMNHIEAYLGCPLYVAGKLFGTLSFNSKKPYPGSFAQAESEALLLMSRLASQELERRQHIRQLEANTEELIQQGKWLAEARDEALEAADLKSEFLAAISHEIRTPMNAILGMSALLLDSGLKDEQLDWAQIVYESAQVMTRLLNDILDYSRIEAGQVAVENLDFELQDVLDAVQEQYAPQAQKKGLAFYLEVDPLLPKRVTGDPRRLQQVLSNLVSNAVKFTAQGEVKVKARLESLNNTEVGLHFSVSDTGIGLTEAARRRLFLPFAQGEGGTTRRYEGSGLGLPIAHRLVELMGGQIGVESEEGSGATFWFTAAFGRCFTCDDAELDALRRSLTPPEISQTGGLSFPVSEPAEETILPEDPLDREHIAGLRSLQARGEPDFLAELIDLYLQSSAPLMETMRAALERGSADLLRRTAANLGSDSANMGARGLSALCRDMENLTRTGTLVHARPLLERIEREYLRVITALKDECRTGRS